MKRRKAMPGPVTTTKRLAEQQQAAEAAKKVEVAEVERKSAKKKAEIMKGSK